MPILLNSKVVRVAINAASYGNFKDQLTDSEVKFPIADLRIEAGFFYGKPNTAQALVDLANWVSVTCTFKALGASNAAPSGADANLAQRTVLAAALNAGMTAEQWAALTHQHVAFDFTEAEINNIPVGKVWCVFTALLNSGKVIPLQFGTMDAVQDGYASAGTTAPAAGTAYTKAEALALFARDRNDITAKTGGAANALDGIVTAAGAVVTGQSVRTLSGAGGGRQEWILIAANTAEDADAGIVRPDDYAPGTNERVWKQIL